jgi:hypothetical protein
MAAPSSTPPIQPPWLALPVTQAHSRARGQGHRGVALGPVSPNNAWTRLKPATRRQRENIMVGVLKAIGHEKSTAIKRADVVASRDARSSTPAQARNFLDAMRGCSAGRWKRIISRLTRQLGVKNPPSPRGQASRFGPRTMWRLSGKMAHRDQGAGLAGRAALLRAAEGRRGQGSAASIKKPGGNDRHHPDPSCAASHPQRWPDGRPGFYLRRPRPTTHQRELRQSIHGGLPESWRGKVGAWRAEDRRHHRSEQRRDGCRAGSPLRMAWWWDGFPLYP